MTQCLGFTENIQCKHISGKIMSLKAIMEYFLLHLNIWRLNKHYGDLETLLANTGCIFDIIGCSESWQNDRSHQRSCQMWFLSLVLTGRKRKSSHAIFTIYSPRLVCSKLESFEKSLYPVMRNLYLYNGSGGERRFSIPKFAA